METLYVTKAKEKGLVHGGSEWIVVHMYMG